MKILAGGIRGFELPMAGPLSTAHGRIAAREGDLLWLADDRGQRGFGEATPLSDFGTEDLATSRRALDRVLPTLVGREVRDLGETITRCAALCQGAPCALAAIDSALHDLAARRAGVSLAGWLRDAEGLGGPPAREIAVQALVGGEAPDAVADTARRRLAAGFAAFKLKLAVSPTRRDLGLDLERVAALRSAVGPESRIRLDANEAWTFDEAERALTALAPFDIDYVEQPVARSDRAGLKRLDECGAVAVAADEALLGPGCDACLDRRSASVFVLKPAALGGITRTRAILRRARASGLRVVFSSLIEGAVGRASATALAAGLGDAGEVHGLGTAHWLAVDLVPALEDACGTIAVADVPGLGCDLSHPAGFDSPDGEGIWKARRPVGAER